MIENRRGFDLFCHAVLILGVLLVVFPVYIAFCAATIVKDRQIMTIHCKNRMNTPQPRSGDRV